MRALKFDTATLHRGAAVFSLGMAATTLMSMTAVLFVGSGTLRPVIAIDYLPDAHFKSSWLPGSMDAAAQQSASAAQWLHVIAVFAMLGVAIAAINALIGLLAHANERRYEMALRGLLGASPRALAKQHTRAVATNALLGIAAGVPAGLACAAWLQSAWHGQLQSHGMLAVWLCVTVACMLGIAAYAGLRTYARTRRAGWLSDALAPGARNSLRYGADDLRALLSVIQLSCGIALSIVAAMVWSYSSAGSMLDSHANTNSDVQVAHVTLATASPAQRHAAIQQILQRLNGTSGVEAESIASPGALIGLGKIDKVISHCGRCVRANMLTPLFPVETQQHVVGAHFFASAGIPVELGREFNGDGGDARGLVINKSFARVAFDDPNPVGKRISLDIMGRDDYVVIGVVADVPTQGLHSLEPDAGAVTGHTPLPNAPAIYFSAAEYPPATFDVIARSHARINAAGLSFEPLAAVFAGAQAPQRWFSRVLMLLAALLCAAAITGAAITTMLSVRSRRMEIAVRRSVGARRRDIWLLIYRMAGGMAMRSLIAGSLLALALSRVLEAFVPGLPVFRASVFGAVYLLFIALIAMAAALPARNAARLTIAKAE